MEHREYIRRVPGSDTAVLLIHGIVGTPRHFDDLLQQIPAEWSVHNLLLDGHGGTVEDFARTSMEKWKAQVACRLGELLQTHKQVLLIGHSMGTLFAIQNAVDHPDRVPALFLLGCPLRVRYPPKTMFQSIRAALGKTDPAAVLLRNDSSVHLSPKLWKYLMWIPRFWELLRECRRIRKLLPALHTPTVCFQSRKDEMVSMKSCKALEKNPVIHTEILEESGHFAYSPGDTKRLRQALNRLLQQYF